MTLTRPLTIGQTVPEIRSQQVCQHKDRQTVTHQSPPVLMHGGLLGVTCIVDMVHKRDLFISQELFDLGQRSRSVLNVKENAGGLTPTSSCFISEPVLHLTCDAYVSAFSDARKSANFIQMQENPLILYKRLPQNHIYIVKCNPHEAPPI